LLLEAHQYRGCTFDDIVLRVLLAHVLSKVVRGVVRWTFFGG
jgi:hypothetical protein